MNNQCRTIITMALLALLPSCKRGPGLPYYNTADFTPVWLIGGNASHLHQVPAFSFSDQNGRTINNDSLNGKLYVSHFFFTSCGSICPVMIKHLLKVQHSFATDRRIAFCSYTVAPWIDSVSRLRHYAEKYGLDSRWHLLTGDKAAIYQLARQGYFAEEEPGYYKDSTEFLHTEHVLLVDTHRHIRGVYNGTLELEIDRLIEDIRNLEKESD